VELYSCISILGYSLLPFCFLAISSLFCNLRESPVGVALCMLIVGWSTVTATRFFEHGLDLEDKKYLIAYPIILFYLVFMLIVL